MRIIALDPSSTCTGYAVMESAETLVSAGLLRPRSSDEAIERITSMACDLRELITECRPRKVVIEVTSGKVAGRHRQRSQGAGLGVYGTAVGAMYAVSLIEMGWLRSRVVPIHENTWTHGVPKAQRQRHCAAAFPAYSMADDPGADVADAIGLGCWYYVNLSRTRAIEAQACVSTSRGSL